MSAIFVDLSQIPMFFIITSLMDLGGLAFELLSLQQVNFMFWTYFSDAQSPYSSFDVSSPAASATTPGNNLKSK